MAFQMDMTDRRLLNAIQAGFPLVEEPYAELGRQIEIPGSQAIERIQRLREHRIVRQISAIFDSRRLGYQTTLVATRYPSHRLDEAAQVINQHPGVSHNYARNGPFNLWFTLAVAPSESLEGTIEELARRTGAEVVHALPALRLFKIGVNFDMVQNAAAAYDYPSPDGDEVAQDGGWRETQPLTELEVRAVRELQEDLPQVLRPFDGMSQRLGISSRELLNLAGSLKERGALRRYGAVLHHREAGFKANAMAVWRVPPERSKEVGRVMASFPWVSHCYQRPTFPDWPYSHFSMIHATAREQCEEAAGEISQRTGITDYMLLYSTREYKKSRVRYFV